MRWPGGLTPSKGNKMRRFVFLSMAGLLAAGIALGEDFWVKKEYMQWTDEEVKKLLTDSPWAKDVTISMHASLALSREGQRPTTEGGTVSDVESGGGGGRGRGRGGGGGGGGGGPAEAIVTMNMSWRSALPLRKALVRSRAGAGAAAIPPEAQKLISTDETDYVLVLTGVPMGVVRALQN